MWIFILFSSSCCVNCWVKTGDGHQERMQPGIYVLGLFLHWLLFEWSQWLHPVLQGWPRLRVVHLVRRLRRMLSFNGDFLQILTLALILFDSLEHSHIWSHCVVFESKIWTQRKHFKKRNFSHLFTGLTPKNCKIKSVQKPSNIIIIRFHSNWASETFFLLCRFIQIKCWKRRQHLKKLLRT